MTASTPQSGDRRPPLTVLFLCTANSARSQMAEGLLRHLAGDRFEVYSAGLEAKGIHPLALRVMAEVGIDISGQRSKNLSEYLGRLHIHHAIIVCDSAAQRCPTYPFAREIHRWPFDDPATWPGGPEAQLAKFREVRDAIRGRLEDFITSIEDRSARC